MCTIVFRLQKISILRGDHQISWNTFKGGHLDKGGLEIFESELGGTNGQGGTLYFKGGPQTPAETMIHTISPLLNVPGV